MKLAWLCWSYGEAEPVIKFVEPERGRFAKVVPIVYAELAE